MSVIASKRLYLREFTPDDVDMIYRLHNDPQVMMYMPYKHISYSRAIKTVDEYIGIGRISPGFGIWATILQREQSCIGWTCLKEFLNTGEIEIGYRYFPEFWNQGYCTEISREVIRHGFQQQQLEHVIGIVHPENGASMRVLEKISMMYRKIVSHFNMRLRYYSITYEEWTQIPENRR